MSLNTAGQGASAGRARSRPGRRHSPEPPGAPSVQGRAPSGRSRRCQWDRAESRQVEGLAAVSPPRPFSDPGAPARRPRPRQLKPWNGRRPAGQRWWRRRPWPLLRAGCAPRAAAQPGAPAPLGVGQSWGPGAAALSPADPPRRPPPLSRPDPGRPRALGPRPGRPCPAAPPNSPRGPRPGRLRPPGGRGRPAAAARGPGRRGRPGFRGGGGGGRRRKKKRKRKFGAGGRRAGRSERAGRGRGERGRRRRPGAGAGRGQDEPHAKQPGRPEEPRVRAVAAGGGGAGNSGGKKKKKRGKSCHLRGCFSGGGGCSGAAGSGGGGGGSWRRF